jgi:DNA-binding MarR family transcriptional regulator
VTPLSTKQRLVLRHLVDAPATTSEIARAAGTSKGTGSMIQSLHQQGLVAYVGGPGVRVGRGKWRLTDRGRAVAAEEEA